MQFCCALFEVFHDGLSARRCNSLLALHFIVVSNMSDGPRRFFTTHSSWYIHGILIRRDQKAAQWGIWHGRRLNLFSVSDATVAGVPRCKIENHDVPKNSVIILCPPQNGKPRQRKHQWFNCRRGLTRDHTYNGSHSE